MGLAEITGRRQAGRLPGSSGSSVHIFGSQGLPRAVSNMHVDRVFGDCKEDAIGAVNQLPYFDRGTVFRCEGTPIGKLIQRFRSFQQTLAPFGGPPWGIIADTKIDFLEIGVGKRGKLNVHTGGPTHRSRRREDVCVRS